MSTSLRLKEARDNYAAKETELRSILESKEKLTAEQRTAMDGIKTELEDLKAEIKRFEDLEAIEMRSVAANAAGAAVKDKAQEEVNKKFSFVRAINMARDGKLEGFEKEMHEEAVKEYRASGLSVQGVGIPTFALKAQKRDMTATGSSGAEGGYGVPTNVGGLLEALSPKLVLAGLGVTMFDNLTGNLDIPSFTTAPTAAWEGEVDTTAEVSPAQAKISFSPNRLAAFVDVSKQLLIQSTPSIDAYLQRFLLAAVASKLQAGALHGSGTGEPAGLAGTAGIGSVVGGTHGAAPLWDDITNLYKQIAIDNADIGSLAYLTNPYVIDKLQNTPRQASGVEGNFIMNTTNQLNGFQCAVTTSVSNVLEKGTSGAVCSAIFFGNWADMALASWGGIDILVNPYTKGKEGITEVILNSYLDANVLRPTSFSAMLDATT
jgi:HK97 family phage major capsid protein